MGVPARAPTTEVAVWGCRNWQERPDAPAASPSRVRPALPPFLRPKPASAPLNHSRLPLPPSLARLSPSQPGPLDRRAYSEHIHPTAALDGPAVVSTRSSVLERILLSLPHGYPTPTPTHPTGATSRFRPQAPSVLRAGFRMRELTHGCALVGDARLCVAWRGDRPPARSS